MQEFVNEENIVNKSKEAYEQADFNKKIMQSDDWICMCVKTDPDEKTIQLETMMKSEQSIRVLVVLFTHNKKLFQEVVNRVMLHSEMVNENKTIN